MGEAYLSLGWPADWRMYVPMGAIMAASPFLIRPLVKSGHGRIYPVHWAFALWGVWMMLGSVFRLPSGFMVGAMPFFFAMSFLFPWRGQEMAIWVRILCVPLFLALGYWTISLDIGRLRIALTATEFEYRESKRNPTRSVNPNEVQVRGYWDTLRDRERDYIGWIVGRPNSMSSMHFSGKELFWGPRGIVRGDQLARQIAEWAGEKPKYITYDSANL